MPDVDNLSIQISAEAQSAQKSLDVVIGRLDKLSTSLGKVGGGGLNTLSGGIQTLTTASLGLSSIKKTDFNRLANSLKALESVNASQIGNIGSSITKLGNSLNAISGISAATSSLSALTTSIASLGYARVDKAIINLPLLTKELNNLMTVLSKAPTVSSNVIQMTNAIANLAAQGQKVGTASKGIVNGLNGFSKAGAKATKKTFSLSSVIGKFYQSMFLVTRGISALKKSVTNSMDYIETLNYFDKAFEQVAKSADYSGLGKDAAKEYYESFANEAKSLTSQLSGFRIGDDGSLSATGQASLSIDPNEVMQYQAMFGQMSSSMGMTAENSSKVSSVLTRLGADLASVKNMDFDKVWTDMASGLAGMSRTLDKYGVNIRNVNLQQKLYDLGIKESITNINQQDKALLRSIILLESTDYAWADLAETLNQPANQLRLIQGNINNLSRIIGDLFMPAISALLPYINGLVIALQRLFTWIGQLAGMSLEDITKGVGDSEDKIGELLGADEAEDEVDGVTNAVKKLKGQLAGFHELNVISSGSDENVATPDTTLPDGILTDAFDKAVGEYNAVWDKAYAEVENTAQKIADNIEKAFQPVKDMISNFAIGEYFNAGQDFSNLTIGIIDMFTNAINSVDWAQIGNNIGKFLAGVDWTGILSSVGEFIWSAINAGITLWSESFNAAPIETAIFTGIALLQFTGIGELLAGKLQEAIALHVVEPVKNTVKEGLKDLGENFSWGKILSIPQATKETGNLKDAFTELFGEKGGKLIGLTGLLAGAGIAVTNFVDMFVNGFSWIKEILMLVGIALAAVAAVILGAPALVAGIVAGIVAAVLTAVIVIKDNWESITSWFKNLFFNIGKFAGEAWAKISGGAKDAVAAMGNGIIWVVESFVNNIIKKINGFLSLLNGAAELINNIPGINIGKITLLKEISIPRFELGGFPTKASLFWAGENGVPELMGTVGGRTAVASGMEITGITDAVYSTAEEEIALLRQQNQLLQGILEKEFGISAGELHRTVRSADREFAQRTGHSAFAY